MFSWKCICSVSFNLICDLYKLLSLGGICEYFSYTLKEFATDGYKLQEPHPLPYLAEKKSKSYDIPLEVRSLSGNEKMLLLWIMRRQTKT